MIVFLIGKLLVVNLSGGEGFVAGIKSWTTYIILLWCSNLTLTTGLLLRGREYCSVSSLYKTNFQYYPNFDFCPQVA
jgi:hypothetical protein